jgi:heme exporter protein C
MQSANQAISPAPIALWKWVSIIILVYVFIAGWVVPLKPGIIEVLPDRAVAGKQLTLNIKGYNTYFSSGNDQVRAWLRLKGDTVIQSQHIEVKDDRNLMATFYIPSVFPIQQDAYPLSLILDHPTDGSSLLPNAVFVSPASEPDSSEINLWTKDKIEHIHKQSGIRFPFRNILSETIRNTYFHVPMWFTMIILFGYSAWYSLKYYRTGLIINDQKSNAFVKVGLIFGLLGLVTGMLWAKNTWNAYWSWDVKQNMSAIALLIYSALMVLRTSVDDEMQRARLSAGYNMFAFVLLIPLLFIIPRMTDSLHPGNGGNPAMGGEDLDNTMRMVFYPAVIGWILLGIWISQLTYRLDILTRKQ